jgi:outer membrane receptor protein involved in Fe transport
MNIYKISISILVFLISFTHVSAQIFGGFGGKKEPTIKGKIEGVILDKVTNNKVGFATVALKKAGKSDAIDGVISDEEGKFKFEDVVNGTYDIYINFLGYEEKKIDSIETTLKDPDLNLGEIVIIPSNFILEGVEIAEERSLYENKVDKLVFNAENDASIAGGDATDVLRKVPLLSVDLDGNVSLRGSQNVRILINGKPSGMFSNNVADALKMFPADQIKKVEVITSPSAKYDGEGSGGIINIITKKSDIEGVAGSVNASVGIRQNSLFTSLNAGKGRFGLSSSAAVFYSVPTDGLNSFLRIDTVGNMITTYSQEGIQNTSRLGGNGNVSMFYDLNAYNSFNSSFNFRGFGFDVDGTLDGELSTTGISESDIFTRSNVGDNFFGGFDWNTDYTRKFEDDDERELIVAVQVSNDNNNQDFTTSETHSLLTDINRDTRIFNDGDNLETTFQLDYVHPLPKSYKLEMGAKGVLRDILSDYNTSYLNNTTGNYDKIDEFSNVFDYNQDVFAGYSTLSFILAKKYSFNVGARYEHTSISGSFKNNEGAFSNDYDNILPSITVSRSLKGFRTLKASYTQRIQRPSLFYINPFNNNVDFLNRTIGNPSLLPEIVDQFELSYNTNFVGFTIFASAFYKKTSEIIESTLVIEDGISINSFDNVGDNNSVGVNLFSTKTINQFTVRFGGNFNTYDAKGFINNQYLENKNVEYNIFFNGDYKFTGTLKADFFGFFRSPRRSLQGNNPSFSIWGFGLRKEFKNSSIGITVIEPFVENKEFNSDLSGDGFSQTNEFALPFRSVGLNFRYKFGSVDFKERKSKIKNSDLKQGENSGGGGGQAPSGGQ